MTPTVAQIRTKLNIGDIAAAADMAREAYINDVTDPLVLDLMAMRLEEQGDLEGAIRLLIEATNLDSENASLHASIGHCLIKLARPTHALEAFNKALKLDPKLPRAHHGAGLCLSGLGQRDAGEQAQLRARQLDPRYAAPVGMLALIAYQRKQFPKAATLAAEALRLDPGETIATMVQASTLFDNGEAEACAAYLTDVLKNKTITPLHRSGLQRTYGDALDALGRYDEAFCAYAESNALLKRIYVDLFDVPDLESALQMCDRLISHFRTYVEPISPKLIRAPDGGGALQHVFLMGFPRSGTTLLEQVLASHNDVVALEEKATLHEAIMKYFMDDNNIENLLKAPEEELEFYRELYWKKVKNFGVEAKGKIFIDKQPSLTFYIPLLKRLFPDSKIIFCVRDPRDVTLSCFRRAFTMNGTIFQYMTLETLTELYAKCMDLAELYRTKLRLKLHQHKHEYLISNFEDEVRALCAFLEVEFDENMKNFVETANRRDIRTPSAKQVRAGLNASGVGYWKHYEQFMAPHAPTLKRWIDAFGYS